jgi:hypothetical protein
MRISSHLHFGSHRNILEKSRHPIGSGVVHVHRFLRYTIEPNKLAEARLCSGRVQSITLWSRAYMAEDVW